ncbi:MAG TPA: UvrB/UvrC motif-containing protein, partial [Planctomycetota bacterium]|nr:UvrB/UvrC motif-containing protein [Planctomycetota bacterium]
RRAIRVMQGIFRFATCSLNLREDDPKRKFFRPCLLYSIHRCTAPCGAKVSKADYTADIDSLRRFLRGDKRGLIGQLTRQMQSASGALQFERAAELRDQVHALESLSKEFSLDAVREMDVEPIDPAVALKDLQEILGLAAPPRTLEACDIATIQGADSVGSIVTFVDGLPFKDGYRHFRIKHVRGMDDFEMMREVVRRRFARLKSEGEMFPELFLVDGGLGQLSAASGVLKSLRVETLLLALAKQEETLFRAGRRSPVRAPKDSLGLRLLMHARDEAHRFAQRYHHLLRRKRTLEE